MRVRSLSQEDPLEEDMAIPSSILAWEIPMDRGAWQATVYRVAKSWTELKRLSMYACTSHIIILIFIRLKRAQKPYHI